MKTQYLPLRWTAAVLGATIFVAAFLLFQVQPLLARYILPWFGGMPEVWTSCMMFFQLFLLAGYAYAHLLSRLPLHRQMQLHTLLVLLAAATLAIIPSDALQPTPDDIPVLAIIWICTTSVGAAYFVLSASSPLLQSWFAQVLPGGNVYRLYALSNIGSLLALATFPFVFEPLFARDTTAGIWSGGFFLYVALIGLCSVLLWSSRRRSPLPAAAATAAPDSAAADAAPTPWRHRLLWLALPMTTSVQLLAVTNMLTLDIAVIPFLWVMPLCLYLLSFILCFDHPRWYKRWVFLVLLIATVAGHIWIGEKAEIMHAGTIITIYAAMLFCCCMICHGELYALRPATARLTGFYLLISAGGAMGGIFVAVIAPLIFTYYHELWLSLLATVSLFLLCQKNLPAGFMQRRRWWVAMIWLVGITAIFLRSQRLKTDQHILYSQRNFFGILNVFDEIDSDSQLHARVMKHGTTYHGLQLVHADMRRVPTAYYGPDSGIGLLLQHWPQPAARRIGGIGLGVGTIATYGKTGDLMRFYEINPEVVTTARQYFTYLDDSAASIEIILGDARLSMNYEPEQNYDILALDAFSSDAVPTHLLTVEAFEIYLRHLNANGVLAVHISTRYLDLQAVVWKLAEHLGLHSRWIQDYAHQDADRFYSSWILLARNDAILNQSAFINRHSHAYADLARTPLWTDDHINLLKVLRRRHRF